MKSRKIGRSENIARKRTMKMRTKHLTSKSQHFENVIIERRISEKPV
jgi:hypothetical protein